DDERGADRERARERDHRASPDCGYEFIVRQDITGWRNAGTVARPDRTVGCVSYHRRRGASWRTDETRQGGTDRFGQSHVACTGRTDRSRAHSEPAAGFAFRRGVKWEAGAGFVIRRGVEWEPETSFPVRRAANWEAATLFANR